MKKIYLIFALIFSSGIIFSQEICNNGIDDDGDGLIDLMDTVDCSCSVTSSINVPSLIPNPSFEDHSCCPNTWSQLNCADTWIQASDATSDYFNTCNYTGASPLPYPNGNGIAGFYPLTNWKEYIGACLLNPLQAGVQYSFNFDMSYNTVTGTFSTCTLSSLPPIDITIYGSTSCSDLPFSGYDCPIGQGNWQVLGTVTVDPSSIFNSWETFTVTFIPPVDINAIVIGPPCNLPAGYPSNSTGSCYPYFYIDGLILNKTAAFNPMQIIVDGDYCTNDLVLSAHNDSVGTYQWYRDSIALVGETNDSLFISANGYPLGDYEVVFTYANGIGCVSDSVYLSTPPLVVSTSNDTTICDNDTAVITAYGGGNYNWDNGLGTNQSYNVNPHSTTTYHVTVSNSHGCYDIDSITVTVTPLPTADFTLSNINCFSDNCIVTYTGNALQSATYNWDFSGGVASPGTGQGPHQVSWSQSGNMNVSLQVTQNGCTSLLNTQSVTNPPLLTTDITSQNLLCFGDNTGYATVNVSGGTVANDYNYYWSNNIHTQIDSNLAAGIYTVTVIDDNNCSSTSTVTITQPDRLEVTSPASIYLCNGRSTIITATTTGGTPNYNYTWNGVAGGSTLIDDPRVTQTYNIIVTDANGCEDSTKTIVNVSEPVNLELISNKDSVCPGEEVQITANINSPAGGPYELSLFNQGLISTPFTVAADTLQNIIVTVTDGCGSKDTDTLHLDFYPVPEVDFSPNMYNGCQPFTVKFNQNIAYNPTYYYVWDFGDNQQDNLSYDYNPEHTFGESGSFNVSLTVRSDKGCENTKLINNLITVYPKPEAKFIANPEVVSLIKPEVEFINLSTITDTSYWNFMDGDTSNTTNPVHYFKQSGTYNVELITTSSVGCRDTVTGKVIVEDPVTFYAPTAFTPDHDGINDEFKIYATGIEKDNFLFQIYDRWGEVIFESTDINKGWNGISSGHKEISSIGSYTWVCSFIDVLGNSHRRTGVFTLYK